MSLLATPFSLLNPLTLKIIVDSVLGSHELPGWLLAIVPSGVPRHDARAVALIAGLLVVIAGLQMLVGIPKRLTDCGART